MEAAAFALIVIVGLVGFGLVALTFMLRRTPRNAFPTAGLQDHWLFDDRFEHALPSAPERLSGKQLDKRVAFRLKHIRTEERAEFAATWHELERRFPQDPQGATRAAHALSMAVMRARGYPVSEHPTFEPQQQAAWSYAELEQTMQRYRRLLESMIDLPPKQSAN